MKPALLALIAVLALVGAGAALRAHAPPGSHLTPLPLLPSTPPNPYQDFPIKVEGESLGLDHIDPNGMVGFHFTTLPGPPGNHVEDARVMLAFYDIHGDHMQTFVARFGDVPANSTRSGELGPIPPGAIRGVLRGRGTWVLR
jgi:hypothetical protein